MSNFINDVSQSILESWPGQILLIFGLFSPLLGWISHIYDPPISNRNFALKLAVTANFFLILIIYCFINSFTYGIIKGLIISLIVIPVSTLIFYFSYEKSTESISSADKIKLDRYMAVILSTNAAFTFIICSLNLSYFSGLPSNFTVNSCIKVNQNIGLNFKNGHGTEYKGKEVFKIQKELKKIGIYNGKINNKYDHNLKYAIETFQGMKQLTKDGIAGCETQRELFHIQQQCCVI